MLSLNLPIHSKAEESQEILPDLELLEFLGSWQDDEGNWIDPMNFTTPMDSRNVQTEEKEQEHE